MVATKIPIAELVGDKFEEDRRQAIRWGETQGMVIAGVYKALVEGNVPMQAAQAVALNFADKYLARLLLTGPIPSEGAPEEPQE